MCPNAQIFCGGEGGVAVFLTASFGFCGIS